MKFISYPQRGSAFWIILIAIAMFAGLSYALIQNGRSSVSSLSDDQARLAARDIVSYSDAVAAAFQALKLRGCTENQISVYHSSDYSWGSYNNAAAPADKSCHVFDIAGGAVNSQKVDTKTVVPEQSYYQTFTAANAITNIGTSAADLLFSVLYLQKNVCIKINDLLGITNPGGNPPESAYLDSPGWNGTFAAPGYTVNQANINGKTAFCLKDTDNYYKYSRVLLAR